MKVLWFSNTPANSDEFLGKQLKGTGGWMKSLDKKLQDNVDLHIAFYSNEKIDDYRYLKTSYYPIHKRSRNFIEKVLYRFSTKITFREDVNNYLQIIDNIMPDIIHIHGTELPYGYVQEKTKIPVVISIQGNIVVYKHKYFSGIEKSYLSYLDVFTNMFFLKKYKEFSIWEFGEQEILEQCKNIIGRTEWDSRISRVLAPNAKYFYVSEILRSSFYKNRLSIPKQNRFVISTTISNSLYKGFETLCHSLTLLNKIEFLNCEWRVAGIDVTDSIVKVVKKKLGENFPKENLVLLGSLNESQLFDSLLETNIYVMTSHIENSPNNLSEAMILGLPCISTFAGGSGSLIENNYNGILIQAGDPFVMAGTILELKSNPRKMEFLGRNARLDALKRHDPGEIIKDLLNVYSEIFYGNTK
jgi:glycosyltransferase involved in cell wall biosynthesis